MVSSKKYVFDLESNKDRDPEAYEILKNIDAGQTGTGSLPKMPLVNLKKDLLVSLVFVRRGQGMTQRDLAEITGIAQSHIARIESGKGNPSLQTLLVLMQALNAQLKVEQPKK